MHQREAVLHLYFYPTIFMLINVYAVIWRTFRAGVTLTHKQMRMRASLCGLTAWWDRL